MLICNLRSRVFTESKYLQSQPLKRAIGWGKNGTGRFVMSEFTHC